MINDLLLSFCSLWSFGAVKRTTLFASIYACRIQSPSKNVITYSGKVFHTTAAHQHDGVFLKIVPFARDVGIHLFLIGQSNTGHFTHSRVRFLGSGRIYTYTNAPSLRTRIQRTRFAFLYDNLAAVAD